MFRFFPRIVILVALFVSAHAQIQNGRVTGVVSDPTGALIANAVVRLDHPVTGRRHELVTGNAGDFVFNNVAFDQYTLHVIASGFEPVSQLVVVRSNLPVKVVSGRSKSCATTPRRSRGNAPGIHEPSRISPTFDALTNPYSRATN